MRMTLILFVLLCLVGAASPANASPDTPVIVCSTTQVADFARQVVGDRCMVRCILAPGADPHTYMPTPQDSKLVAGADLCLENGLHLEGNNWMKKLATDAGKPVVACTDGIKPLEMTYAGKKVLDPHAWFSPANAAIYIRNILKAVSALDSAGSWEYEARARLYLQELRTLDGWIREQVNLIPPQQRVLVTSHDAFNYFCNAFKFNPKHGYLSLAPVGWSTGSEVGGGMTPERRKEVVDSIRSFGARAVFVETSVNPKLIRQISQDAGVKIGGTLYSDSMGEAGSAGETYIGMMRENIVTIVKALADKG